MRLKLVQRGVVIVVEVWVDMARDRSCGESRSDWSHVATLDPRRLAIAVMRLVTGQSAVEEL